MLPNDFAVFAIDDLPPEAIAMLQALYSRDPRSVMVHLEQVKKLGPEKFMSTFYVGYGHRSIGDCGTTSFFIENVSMLAAKAIQDWPLYNGQEASTRYLDMSKQPFLNPLGTAGGAKIQDEWRAFYSYVLEMLVPHLKVRFPLQEGQEEKVYEKAIKARAFDIARGFLPAGATTFVSWHTNLRQAADHLKGMRHHPLGEVRNIAEVVLGAAQQKYAASFLHKKYDAEEDYVSQSEAAFAYLQDVGPAGAFLYKSHLDVQALCDYPINKLLNDRPPKAELHHRFRQYGTIDFSFPIDFGSYRDLQRQRSCVQEMPLLTTKWGFHEWYLEQLTPALREVSTEFIKQQAIRIAGLDATDVVKQYYVGMGYVVPAKISCTLPSAVYIAELRSTDAVHPTLRVQAQRMGDALEEAVPGLKMHHDRSPGTWNIRRGTHDIVKV
jgi:hypothetical protein